MLSSLLFGGGRSELPETLGGLQVIPGPYGTYYLVLPDEISDVLRRAEQKSPHSRRNILEDAVILQAEAKTRR